MFIKIQVLLYINSLILFTIDWFQYFGISIFVCHLVFKSGIVFTNVHNSAFVNIE